MNNSVNYSGFIDWLLDIADEYEPYGYSELSAVEEVANERQAVICKYHWQEDLADY